MFRPLLPRLLVGLLTTLALSQAHAGLFDDEEARLRINQMRSEYNARLEEIGTVYRDLIGHHYPAMSAVQVAGFVEAGAKVEIEVTAVLPDD